MSHSTGNPQFRSRAFFTGVLLLLLTLGLPGVVSAQSSSSSTGASDDASASSKQSDQTWKTKASLRFEYQGNTELDSGGHFSDWMVGGAADSRRMIGDSVIVDLAGDYRAIGYDFGGVRPSGGGPTLDPWETVHVLRLSPLFGYNLNDSWSLIGGPVIEFSAEVGAQFDDSLRGGGVVGFGYRRPGLVLYLGVLAVTEIEKDARIQPFVLVDWDITDGLAFAIKADTSRGGDARLKYNFTKKFRLAAGIGVRRELFRLNGDGPTRRRDGVGEEISTVATMYATYRINEQIAIEAYGGITIDGEFRLETRTGNKIATSDYDDSGYGGVNLRFNF